MPKVHQYFVYIVTNRNHRVLYTGVTSDLRGRAQQHKDGTLGGFTTKYRCKKLVFFEYTEDVNAALNREKQIKKYSRHKKLELISSMNPNWLDLAEELT